MDPAQYCRFRWCLSPLLRVYCRKGNGMSIIIPLIECSINLPWTVFPVCILIAHPLIIIHLIPNVCDSDPSSSFSVGWMQVMYSMVLQGKIIVGLFQPCQQSVLSNQNSFVIQQERVLLCLMVEDGLTITTASDGTWTHVSSYIDLLKESGLSEWNGLNHLSMVQFILMELFVFGWITYESKNKFIA